MSRRPAQSLASLPPGPRSREQESRQSELLSTFPVTAELTSVTTAYVRHGLRRRYVGALVVGQDSGGGECRVLRPETVSAAGENPTQVVGLSFSSAFTGTVNLRVF